MTRRRCTVVSVVVLLTAYFLLLPGFWSWMPPRASVEIPAAWPHNQDLPIAIRISSWHSNCALQEVRFCVLPDRSRFDKPTPPMYPLILVQSPPTRSWNRFTLNRFTFPRTERVPLTVPLKALAAEGKVGPGTLAGAVIVRLDYVGSVDRYSGGPGFRELSNVGGCRQEFQIALK